MGPTAFEKDKTVDGQRLEHRYNTMIKSALRPSYSAYGHERGESTKLIRASCLCRLRFASSSGGSAWFEGFIAAHHAKNAVF